MRKKNKLTFESFFLAMIAGGLNLWMLIRLLSHAVFAGAGCIQENNKFTCSLDFNTGYSGFASLVAWGVAFIGLYGAIQCLCSRRSGAFILIVLFATQIIGLNINNLSFYVPSALNFYYEYVTNGLIVNFNILPFLLFLNTVGKYRNERF
ncbi:MAG: hypothetical protein Q4A74_05800 [Cardiobacteriaceae bacterium]|nr:hypothetical protein [Cardiobacteriaceae bacterium]